MISKAASDCVAGVIEGLADRYENLRIKSNPVDIVSQRKVICRNLDVFIPNIPKYKQIKHPILILETLAQPLVAAGQSICKIDCLGNHDPGISIE